MNVGLVQVSSPFNEGGARRGSLLPLALEGIRPLEGALTTLGSAAS